MFGSEILDVAIGLIMMFLLVSLICSSIKEAFETVLNHRAKDLERGLREMLGDISREGMVPAFYKHPLIDGLFRGDYVAGKTRNLPSYIPSRTFSLAMIDLISKGIASPVKKDDKAADPLYQGPTMELFKTGIEKMDPNSQLRGALLPILAVAGEDGRRLQIELEQWYDATMDRVSGWYKKRTQVMLALIGMSLAVAMNIDAIAMLRYLNTNQTAREVMIAQVKQFQTVNPTLAKAERTNQMSEFVDPMGFLERQGGVPLGWSFSPLPGQTPTDFVHDWRRAPDSWSTWLFKIAGLLLTGFAVTLGAPFWFDVLNRFMVVRSTVKPDEKSPTESSKA